MVDFTVEKFGRLDIAFNNAGVEWKGPLDQATEAEYRRIFDINVWGVLNSMRHEIPAMLKNGGGAIVNTSSVAGHVGLAQVSIYTASKHAVEGLDQGSSRWSSPNKIFVLTQWPRGVMQPKWSIALPEKNCEMRDHLTISSSGRAHWRERRNRRGGSLSLFRQREIYDRHFPRSRWRIAGPIKNTCRNRNITSRTIEVDLLLRAFEEAKD